MFVVPANVLGEVPTYETVTNEQGEAKVRAEAVAVLA